MDKRVPQLDAVRGVAILVVIIHNSSSRYPLPYLHRLAESGWMGVDLFFVLSGFLITGILLGTKDSEGYFKNFYARRCLRIWPLYYSLLVFLFVVVPLVRPREAAAIFEARSSPWWAYPLFLQNFLVPFPSGATGPLGPMWSLAVEEQFYLVWPWVVRYGSPNWLRRIAIAVICLSPIVRFFAAQYGVVIYSNTFCRLDGLMGGAFLALAVSRESFRPSRFTGLAWAGLLVAGPLAVLTDAANHRWFVHSLVAVAATSFVYLALHSSRGWVQATMKNRFLVYTGTVSYGLYLLHKLPFDAFKDFRVSGSPVLVFAIGLAGSFTLAAVSWSVLEKPFLNLKRRFVPQRVRQTSATFA